MADLQIVGAKKHNLKNISLNIPKNRLVVITGVSGSGKSSLAMDTISQEGQRRYLETLVPHARWFTKPLGRPDVRSVRGISPVIALDARGPGHDSHAIVATICDLAPYLRLLFARAGKPRCPECGKTVLRYSHPQIVDYLFHCLNGKSIGVYAPMAKEKTGVDSALFDKYVKRGFLKVWIDDQEHYLDEAPSQDPCVKHAIALKIDALAVTEGNRRQLEESIRIALHEGDGEIIIQSDGTTISLSTRLKCNSCDVSLPEPQPEMFSFTSAKGACHRCRGSGMILEGGDCETCRGTRLNRHALAFRFRGKNIFELGEMEVAELLDFFRDVSIAEDETAILRPILPQILRRLETLATLSLGYMTLNRRVGTLSGGEWQRARLVSQIGFSPNGVVYILDEPSVGLHPKEQQWLIGLLKDLQEKGNSIIVVEHDAETIRAADWVIDMGPGAGERGGEVVFAGTLSALLRSRHSQTADFLSGRRKIASVSGSGPADRHLEVRGLCVHNVHDADIRIPVGNLTVVSGVSGSGKSSLVVQGLYPILKRHLSGQPLDAKGVRCRSLDCGNWIQSVQMVDQSPIGKNARSCPATYLQLMPQIRKLFAGLTESRMRGWASDRFSYNHSSGRCPTCRGLGVQLLPMGFLPHLETVCPACEGRRFQSQVLQVKFRGHSIADILDMTAAEAARLFAAIPGIASKMKIMIDMGLEYLRLGHGSPRLSGGESQRIKLAREIGKTSFEPTLFIMDEPTVGLHFADIDRLVEVFRALLARGHTLVVIEHHPTIIRMAGHLIDLGPGGGRHGGRIVYQGVPEGILASSDSQTGRYLRENTNGI